MESLQDYLELENTSDILDFRVPGTDYLLWPHIRVLVLRMVSEQRLLGDGWRTIGTVAGRSRFSFRKAACFVDGLVHNWRSPYLSHPAPLLFCVSGDANVLTAGGYLHRLGDYFADQFPDATLLLEDPSTTQWRHAKPRLNHNLVYTDPFHAHVLWNSVMRSWSVDRAAITRFLLFLEGRLKNLFGFAVSSAQRDFLETTLVRYCAGLPTQIRSFGRLCDKLGVSLAVFEDGCYGGRGHLIRLANDMGLHTAEMQHGLLSSGHYAYNYAPVIRDDARYKQYLPRYFLSWGEWWGRHVNVPCEQIVIGNPHHQTMRKVHDAVNLPRDLVLIISSGEGFEEHIETAQRLQRALSSKYRIMIRPHPSERGEVLGRYGTTAKGIQIDQGDDLYFRFRESSAVVGYMSSALFEAIGIAERIFSRTHPLTTWTLPENPFEQFLTVDELVGRLGAVDSGKVLPELSAAIWADNWENRYREWITRCLGLSL